MAKPGLCFSFLFFSLDSPIAHSTVPDSSRCLLTWLIVDTFNNCLLMPIAGQTLGGQRLDTVPVITKFKSGEEPGQTHKQ